jgi:hypothetical protein
MKETTMKAFLTALGVVAFAATMAVAKTGGFHTPADTGGIYQSYAKTSHMQIARNKSAA